MAPLHCVVPTPYDFDNLYLPDIIDEHTIERQPKKSKKNVQFAFCVDVCVVPHVCDMTREEFHATFYTSKDYKKMERDNHRTLLQMTIENRVDVENDSLYFRGLEVHLPNATEERKRRQQFVVSQILREQEVYGTIREEWVQDFSSRFTAQNAAAALRRGQYDRRASKRS